MRIFVCKLRLHFPDSKHLRGFAYHEYSEIVFVIRNFLAYIPPTIHNSYGTALNGMDFKFVSHGLWSEQQSIFFQHMHQKEFWILTNKSGNKLKHENEAEGPRGGLFRVYAYFHIS